MQVAKTENQIIAQNEMLTNKAIELANKSKAKNTKRSYSSAITNKSKNGFLDICIDLNLDFESEPINAITKYIANLYDVKGLKISTIKNRLAGVNAYFKILNTQNQNNNLPNISDNIVVKSVLAGMVRDAKESTKESVQNQGRNKQAKTASLFEIQTVISKINTDTKKGKRDKAILLVGLLGGFRRSELTNLKIKDVKFENGFVTVTIWNSKTDKNNKGFTKQIPMSSNPNFCAYIALQDWLQARKNCNCENVFVSVAKGDKINCKSMSGESIRLLIKKYLGKDFSAHSLRVSLTVIHKELEVNPNYTIDLLGWSSDRMYQHYSKQANAKKIAKPIF